MVVAKKVTLVESKPDDYTYQLTSCQGFFQPIPGKVLSASGE
jgi:hypothetical protein